MSSIEVKITKIEVLPHENSDRLALARINGEGGFISVVGKDQFRTGDLALYVGPDSVLPVNIQEHLAKVSKIKVDGGRIRAVKIRGIISEGLCLKPEEWLKPEDIYDGNEVASKLNIIKYQPKVTYAGYHVPAAKGVNLNYKNEHFPEYTHIERFQKYPNVIKPDERVIITKKLHGMNCRFGLTRHPANRQLSWWQKFKNIFVPEDSQIYLIGSHSSVRNAPSKRNKFVGDLSVDPFCCLADKYGMKTNLQIISKFFGNKDVVIYGERIGWASPETPVQRCKNYLYDYGVEKGRQELRVFDIMVDGQYLNWDEVAEICSALTNIPTVEIVYDGPWSLDLLKLAEGKDIYNGKEYIREGIVIKPAVDRRDPHCGRVIFKQLNPEYLLLKDNTELQ